MSWGMGSGTTVDGGSHSEVSNEASLTSRCTARSNARAQWHRTHVAGQLPSSGAEADSDGEHGSGMTRSRIPPVLAPRKLTNRRRTSRRTTSFIAPVWCTRQGARRGTVAGAPPPLLRAVLPYFFSVFGISILATVIVSPFISPVSSTVWPACVASAASFCSAI
jgi:hypothetical protein